MKMHLRSTLLFLLILLLAASTVWAGPANPIPTVITQPDGSTLTTRLRGDEFQNWFELVETGHTVMPNPATGYWEYAVQNDDGTLKRSGVVVRPKGRNVPAEIPVGLRPPRNQESAHQMEGMLKDLYQQRSAGPKGGSARAGAMAVAAAPGDWLPAPVSGPRKMLVILVSFADRAITTTPASWSSAVFDPAAKSVAKYYQDNSFSTLSLAPVAHSQSGNPAGVVSVSLATTHPNLPTNYTFASDQAWGNSALAQAADYVDFNSLDSNGDGILDPSEVVIYFVVAGYEYSAGSGLAPAVWAHAWWTSGSGLTAGSKNVQRWSQSGEYYNATTQMPMGVIAHELGHQIGGLPDLYDISGHNQGLGDFSLMASGSWGGNVGEAYGTTPTLLDAWSREFLGWATPLVPSSGSTVSLPTSLSATTAALKFISPTASSSEYFLAEYRYPTGWDLGLNGLLSASGWAGGLLLTHIDITAGELGSNDINSSTANTPSPGHQGVVPVQASTASCDMLAEGATCRGSGKTLFYQGNNSSWGPTTAPNSNYYNGTVTTYGLDNISLPISNLTMVATIATPIENWIADGLWHEISDAAAPAGRLAVSPSPKTWWYGQEATGTYDTGVANAGSIYSPQFSINPGDRLTFSSWARVEIDPAYDLMTVAAAANGGDWQVIYQDSSHGWREVSVDLTSFVGQSVKFRFTFNTIDALSNNYQGWYVDDIRVGQTSTVAASDLPKAIVDQATVTSSLTVSSAETLSDVKVGLDLTHTWDSDLTITLIAPDGTRVLLASGNGGGGQNFSGTIFDDAAPVPIATGTAPFTGSFAPLQPLSALDGKGANGMWSLEITDAVRGDQGILTGWSLALTTSPASNTKLLTVEKTGTGSGTVTSQPGGISCGTDCSKTFVAGSLLTLTAVAAADSVFSGWSGGGCAGSGDKCVLTLSGATTVTASFVKSKITPVLTWATPAPISYGTALGGSQLNASSGGVAGTFVYTPPAGTLLAAGSGHTLAVTFTPSDPVSYNPASKTVTLAVSKATPLLAWATPADIPSGTALGGNQLNASAPGVAGTFSYTPAAGTILPVGSGQVLTVTFTPSDPANYTAAKKTVLLTVYAPGPAGAAAMIGVYAQGDWYLDLNNNGTWEPGADFHAYFGSTEMTPVVGDWNGDGHSEIGAYQNGTWYLDLNGNGVWDGEPSDRMVPAFGYAGAIPVTGDWNGDGVTEIGVYDPNSFTWYLDYNGNFVYDPGIDIAGSFGFSGCLPVVGDWSGNGHDKIGVYYQGQWYLDLNGNFAWDGSPTDTMVANYGFPGMVPLAGDWNGSGVARIGGYYSGDWYLDIDGNGEWNPPIDRYLGPFGSSGMVPVVGRW